MIFAGFKACSNAHSHNEKFRRFAAGLRHRHGTSLVFVNSAQDRGRPAAVQSVNKRRSDGFCFPRSL